MIVIIAGGRNISDRAIVLQAIHESGWMDDITMVLCGASEQDVIDAEQGLRTENVDIIGAIWARHHGIEVRYYPPKWKQFPKNSAGPIRNGWMVEKAEGLILVWNGTSRGSSDVKKKAEKKGIPIKPFLVDVPDA